MRQLELVLFRKRKFIGKVTWPWEGPAPDGEAIDMILINVRKVFKYDGFRLEHGEHNATRVIAEDNAGPRK